jgi:hypothetical protein
MQVAAFLGNARAPEASLMQVAAFLGHARVNTLVIVAALA